MMIRNMKEEKPEKPKQFTKEQLQSTLDEIESLKKKIEVNRSVLNSTTKNNEMRMHNLLEKNKEIEVNYKKSEKENKKLVFTKNELKRKIRMLNGNDGKGLNRGGGYNAERMMHKEMIVAKDQVNEEEQQEVQMEGGDDEKKEVLVQGIEQEQGEDVDNQVNGGNMEVNGDNGGNVEIERDDGNEVEQNDGNNNVNEGGNEEEMPPQDQELGDDNRVDVNDE
jgi:hypothetical protein